MGNCFSCGKEGHNIRDCPIMKGKDKENLHSQDSGSIVGASKKNRFYALRSRGEQESSPDVVNGMLQVFSIDAYDLLDPGDILSFVTPLILRNLRFCPIS